ncbi:hypothetical protein JAAARDRAFT_31359 [Jaapia argillacea MUCL 33604]|uniref:Uncharacterized protein n=1 Tax=Jaapia argillacea MUCL 33604 TaxID=933084 RepID=A0A067Q490_9AGAM|nr:hypothetical protein JAAARDRAFT_31359 [Jaapia argillacea MUCL 33604]
MHTQIILQHCYPEVKTKELRNSHNPHVAELLGIVMISDAPAVVLKGYANGNAADYLRLSPCITSGGLVFDMVAATPDY